MADLEEKLRELAACGGHGVFQSFCQRCTERLELLTHVAALGRAEGLEEAAKLVRGFTPRKATYEQLANAIEELK